jgi:hypothetical protein
MKMNKINFKSPVYIAAITVALALSPSLTQSEDQSPAPKLSEDQPSTPKLIEENEEGALHKSEIHKKDAETKEAESTPWVPGAPQQEEERAGRRGHKGNG